MAEGILRHKIQERGLSASVDSAGTAGYHIGQAPDERATAEASRHSIDISSLSGRQFSTADFLKFDRIYAMDSSNYRDIIHLAETPEQMEKVDLILNLSHPGKSKSVPDPYYGGAKGFEEVFDMLDQACEILVHELQAQ